MLLARLLFASCNLHSIPYLKFVLGGREVAGVEIWVGAEIRSFHVSLFSLRLSRLVISILFPFFKQAGVLGRKRVGGRENHVLESRGLRLEQVFHGDSDIIPFYFELRPLLFPSRIGLFDAISVR